MARIMGQRAVELDHGLEIDTSRRKSRTRNRDSGVPDKIVKQAGKLIKRVSCEGEALQVIQPGHLDKEDFVHFLHFKDNRELSVCRCSDKFVLKRKIITMKENKKS